MHTADAVAPVVREVAVVGDGVNGWYADPATVRVAATDDRRVDRLEVSVDDGDWTRLPGSSGTVRVAGDGTHTVEVRAVDAAGNVGEIRPLVVGIDATAPVSQGTLDTTARTVALTAADSGSGVGRVEFRLGSGEWTTYDQPVQVGAVATTLEHRAVDRLGNAEQPGRLAVPAAGAQLAASLTAAAVSESPVRIGRPVRVDVTVSTEGATPTGTVVLVGPSGTLASGTVSGGRAVLAVPSSKLGVGTHALTVRYGGDAARAGSQDAIAVEVAQAVLRDEGPRAPRHRVSTEEGDREGRRRGRGAGPWHGHRQGPQGRQGRCDPDGEGLRPRQGRPAPTRTGPLPHHRDVLRVTGRRLLVGQHSPASDRSRPMSRASTTKGNASMIRTRLRAAARTWTVGAILLAASMGGVVAGVGPSSAADAGPAQEAVEAVALVHADDVRGNLTLPVSGLNGATLTWSSGNPSVVSDTGEVSRPAYGEAPVDVPLTVTGTVDSSTASATIVARVQALPEPADYEAYAFAYFAGESTDVGEQIYFGASRGNDPLDYDVLNDSRPVLLLDLRHPRPARPLHHPLGGGRPLLPARHRPQGLSGRRLRRGAGDRQQVHRGLGVRPTS